MKLNKCFSMVTRRNCAGMAAVLAYVLFSACGEAKKSEEPLRFESTFEECIGILGTEFESGVAVVGQTDGPALIQIYQTSSEGTNEWRVRVTYRVFLPISGVSDIFTEDGELSNFIFEEGKYFGAKNLSANWSPDGSGDGKFTIAIIQNKRSDYVAYIGIVGKSWNYYDNVKLDSSALSKLVSILEGNPHYIATTDVINVRDSITEVLDSATYEHQNVVYNEPDFIEFYICKSDYLKLREDSSMESRVIEYIRINDTLDNLYNQSFREDTVTIGGVKLVRPWYQVKSRKGNEGWVHGCCIESVN